jgi:acyl-CoA dehydrogenase family protein 9
MGSSKSSFMKNVFNGTIQESYLHHFPFFTTNREEEFRLVSQSIGDWLKENVDPMKLDDEKKIPEDVLQGLKEMGLFGLIIPEIHGGSEFTQTLYTRTLELMNKHESCVTLTIGAHQSIGLKGLYLYGTDEQKKKYMPRLATGEMIAAFALTEPTAGSDAAGIKARLVREGDHYILNGSKLWITNGGFADFFTVFAKENVDGEDKITAIMVTRDMGGVSHGPEEQKLGMFSASPETASKLQWAF